jgi:similar to stage IV sporulation protein
LFLLEKLGLWPGYLLISLEGRGLVRLLNLTSRNDIYFWDLKYKGNTATMKLRPRDFKKLRPLLRKTGCKVTILQKKGTLFLIFFGKRRKGLLLGILLFSLALYFFSAAIWSINVEGNVEVSKEEVVGVLEKYGVKRGTLKRNLDLTELERKLILELRDLSWVGINLRGVYLQIQVAERLKEPAPEAETLNLVASKDGLVSDILVLAGQAKVEKGDTVSKGQLLIAGEMVEKIYISDEEYEERILPVRARGVVEAHVWYEGYQYAPLHPLQKNKSGNMASSYALNVGGREHHLWGTKGSPYRNYEMGKIKHTLKWRSFRLPVELVCYRYWEIEVDYKSIPPWEALQEARQKAFQEVNSRLPRGVTIQKRLVDDYYFPELGSVGCRVMVETIEDIAVQQVPGVDDQEIEAEKSLGGILFFGQNTNQA